MLAETSLTHLIWWSYGSTFRHPIQSSIDSPPPPKKKPMRFETKQFKGNKYLLSNKYQFNKVDERNNLGEDGNDSAVGGDWGGSVGGLGRDVGHSLTFVPDVGDEAGGGVADVVRHDLGPAVGKLDAVFAGGGVSVAVLVVAEVGAAGVAVGMDAVAELVCWGIDVLRLTVSGGRSVDRSRSVEWPRGIGSGDNPDEGSV